MKQFKFFASMALLALAAACTNEDLQMEVPVTGQEGRPEAVDFSFTVNEPAETRLEFAGNGWKFQAGDKIGAMLMDEWDPTVPNSTGEELKNFIIVDYAHTNYAATRGESSGTWALHEDIHALAGNYFFYFPYEPVSNARGHFGFSVNPIQPQYDENGKYFVYQPVKDNQKWLSYQFIPVKPGEPQEITFNLDFAPVFATPIFEIKNMAGDLIVDKVAVRMTKNDVDVNDKEQNELVATTAALVPATAQFSNVRGQWNNDGNAVPENNLMWSNAIRYTAGVAKESYVWPVYSSNASREAWKPNGRPFYPLSKDYADTYKQCPAYEYVADFSGLDITDENRDIKQFESIKALLVMPAGNYNVNAFEALVYVSTKVSGGKDKFVVRVPLKMDTYSSDDVHSGAGHRYLAPGKITKFVASFDAAGLESYDIENFEITSSEDLKWIVEQVEATGVYNLTVHTSGERVALTKEIEDILPENVHLYVNGKITIAADASSNAINKLYFDNANISTDLTVLNEQVAKKAIDNCGTITVEKGGAIKGNQNITADKVKNAGEIQANTLTAQVNNSGVINANAIIGDVTNSGTVTVTGDINGNVYNNSGKLSAKNINGNAENKAGAELTVNGTVSGYVKNWGKVTTINTVAGFLTNYQGAEATVNTTANFDNFGTLNLEGSATAIADGENKGTLNVNGAYSIAGALANESTINANADITVLEDGTLQNKKGTINVAANVTVLAKEGAAVENSAKAVINVSGKLAEEVKNSGIIYVKGNGKVIVNGNLTQDVKGIIDVTEATGAEADAQKAMDYVAGEEGNAFRYVVKESSNAADLKAALFARISSNNFTTNDIIVLFDANKSVKYYGKYVNDPIPNIAYVKVVKGTTLTFTADGKENAVNFPQLDAENSQTVPEYKPFEVENGATLIVADKVVVTIPAVDVWVNGIFNVNDHASLKGAALVKGNGVTISATAASNKEWSIDYSEWTGEDTGWNLMSSVESLDQLLKALRVKGQTLSVPKGIQITEDMTIDLNGCTLVPDDSYTYTGASDLGVISVTNGATVTIKNGTIDASNFDGGIACVSVYEGTAIIESGTYKLGDDATGRNDLIYVKDNNEGNQAIINGGEFHYTGSKGNGWLYTLNANNAKRDKYAFVVNGGSFYQFIPGTTNPDGWGMEVSLGAGKQVYKDGSVTTDTAPTSGAWYTVK